MNKETYFVRNVNVKRILMQDCSAILVSECEKRSINSNSNTSQFISQKKETQQPRRNGATSILHRMLLKFLLYKFSSLNAGAHVIYY